MMNRTIYTTCRCGHRWGRHCGENRCGEGECTCPAFIAIERVCAICKGIPRRQIALGKSDEFPGIVVASLDIGDWHLPVIDQCVTLCIKHNRELIQRLETEPMFATPETINPIQVSLTQYVSWKS